MIAQSNWKSLSKVRLNFYHPLSSIGVLVVVGTNWKLNAEVRLRVENESIEKDIEGIMNARFKK